MVEPLDGSPAGPSNEQRKADHIRINVEEDIGFKTLTNGFDNLYFMHQAVPELDLARVSTSAEMLDMHLACPILISSMTGGTPEALQINRALAAAAQEAGIALALGSVRAAIENHDVAYTFQVRDVAPDIPILANLGAVQFNYGFELDHCLRAIDICEADALILHFNPLQEAVQPEGDVNFSGLLSKIETICRALHIPVIAKEVGWGFSAQAARSLANAGIAALDVAGAGGTSWSQVEMHRSASEMDAEVASSFVDWGIPTAQSLRICRQELPDMPLVASGGMRNGIDAAKAVALGASLVGFAGMFLRAATAGGSEAVIERLQVIDRQLRIAMFAAGVANLDELTRTQLYDRSIGPLVDQSSVNQR